MAVSSCTFYDDYIEHAIEDMFIFGQIALLRNFSSAKSSASRQKYVNL